MSAASDAKAAQANGGYTVDEWMNLELEPMTKLWQGVGGQSNFFFSEEGGREASGAYAGTKPHRFAETLWRLAQVEPHGSLGYRREISEFVVDIAVEAAVGLCTANRALGPGHIFQYYIPSGYDCLMPTGRTYRFRRQSYR